MNPITPALALFFLATALHAQSTPSATSYGRGCQLPSSPPPLIRAANLPRIGNTFTVRFIGPNAVTPVSEDQPVLLTGVQRASIPVPPLSSLQIPGCNLLLSPLVYLPMPRAGSRFQDTVQLPIPLDSRLLGVRVYQQFAAVYRRCGGGSCTDMMIRVSDGLDIVIGI